MATCGGGQADRLPARLAAEPTPAEADRRAAAMAMTTNNSISVKAERA